MDDSFAIYFWPFIVVPTLNPAWVQLGEEACYGLDVERPMVSGSLYNNTCTIGTVFGIGIPNTHLR